MKKKIAIKVLKQEFKKDGSKMMRKRLCFLIDFNKNYREIGFYLECDYNLRKGNCDWGFFKLTKFFIRF